MPRSEVPLQKIERLRLERADTLAEMRIVSDKAEAQHRDLSPAESTRFRTLDADFSSMTEEIEALESEHRYGSNLTRSAASPDRNIPGADDDGRSDVLRGEQRMVDWAREKYGDNRALGGDGADLSLGRVIQGMVTGEWRGNEAEQRALSEGTDSAGGFLTPEVLGSQVIDKVRARAKVLQAGATVVPLESDKQFIPRLATDVTGSWRAENSAVTESDPTFERVTFSTKTIAVLTRVSFEMFDDLSDAGARAIENSLVQSISNSVDAGALRGTGASNQPTGIRNQSGVTIQSLGANGASPTYSALVNAVATIQGNNLDATASIYSARTSKALAILTDTTGQPLRPSPILDPVTRLVSNQIPDTLTQGTSNAASEIYTAQWDQLLIGIRPRVKIQATQATGAGGFPVNVKASSDLHMDTMQVTLLAWIRADVQLAHPEAFVVSTGALA